MMNTVLEFKDVYKKFRKGEIYDSLRDLIPALISSSIRKKTNHLAKQEFWALQGINFKITKGEAFGIIGANGAGKSTMLKLLSRILRPTQGEILINGKLSALIEVGAGFHPDLTGRENIFLYGTILGMKKKEIDQKFDEIVDFSGLDEFIDTPVKRYSSGMYARLGFSVAAHIDPDILLVDEVLSVGDFVFQKKCEKKLNDMKKNGQTVVFVSHNLKAISELCSKAMLLDKGKVVTIGPTEEVLATYMSRVLVAKKPDSNTVASIRNMVIRDQNGPSLNFISGQKIWIDIEILAHQDCDKLGVWIEFKDEHLYSVFGVSILKLLQGTFSMYSNQLITCTFEIDLNLGKGIFYLGVNLYQFDIHKGIDQTYDTRFPAATLFIESDIDFTGAAYLNPKIVNNSLLINSLDNSREKNQ